VLDALSVYVSPRPDQHLAHHEAFGSCHMERCVPLWSVARKRCGCGATRSVDMSVELSILADSDLSHRREVASPYAFVRSVDVGFRPDQHLDQIQVAKGSC